MVRAVESTHALLEQIAYQMKNKIDEKKFGGLIALTKVQVCSDCCGMNEFRLFQAVD